MYITTPSSDGIVIFAIARPTCPELVGTTATGSQRHRGSAPLVWQAMRRMQVGSLLQPVSSLGG